MEYFETLHSFGGAACVCAIDSPKSRRILRVMGLVRRITEQSPPAPAPAARKRLRDLRWEEIEALFDEAMDGWSKHNCARLGAALAFYTLLSLTPLMLILISIAGLVFGARAAHAGVFDQLTAVIGAQRTRIVGALIAGAKSRTGGYLATAFGAVTLLFGASAAVTELRDDLNLIWGVAPRRTSTAQSVIAMAKERLWAFAFVLGMGAGADVGYDDRRGHFRSRHFLRVPRTAQPISSALGQLGLFIHSPDASVRRRLQGYAGDFR